MTVFKTPQEGWARRRGVPVRLFKRLSYWNANTEPSIPIIPGSSKHRKMKKPTRTSKTGDFKQLQTFYVLGFIFMA